MQTPPVIVLRRLTPTGSVERAVRRHVAALERYCPRIQSCRVIVEAPHPRHVSGNLYHVRLEVRVPGREIVVKRDPAKHHAHQDALVAVRDAFHSARRRLEDWVREVRGVEKAHAESPHARVVRLVPAEGYGFLETPEGREVYFHRNSLLRGSFAKLRVGSRVRFLEEAGADGPQATSVRIVGRPRAAKA